MKKLTTHTQAYIIQRLKQLDELQTIISGILGIELEDTSLWPVITKQQLTIFTDNPLLATQVKYQQKKICTHLNNVYNINLEVLHTKLIPSKIASQPKQKTTNTLKRSTLVALSSIANEIKDNELKQILKNISKQ